MLIATSRQHNNHDQSYDLILHFDVDTQAEVVQVMQELDEQMICFEDHEKIVKIEEPDMPEDFFDAGGFAASFTRLTDETGKVLDPEPDLVAIFS